MVKIIKNKNKTKTSEQYETVFSHYFIWNVSECLRSVISNGNGTFFLRLRRFLGKSLFVFMIFHVLNLRVYNALIVGENHVYYEHSVVQCKKKKKIPNLVNLLILHVSSVFLIFSPAFYKIRYLHGMERKQFQEQFNFALAVRRCVT